MIYIRSVSVTVSQDCGSRILENNEQTQNRMPHDGHYSSNLVAFSLMGRLNTIVHSYNNGKAEKMVSLLILLQ